MKVELLAEAEEELYDAAAWYDERRSGLGDEMAHIVFEGIAMIRRAPHAWPPWPDAPERNPLIRKLVLPRFPYSLAYQAFEGRIVVLGVVHAKRRPLYWVGRAH